MNYRLLLLINMLFWAPNLCLALDPFEIHVHSDEMAAPGKVNLELGVNNFMDARRESEYEGEIAPHGVTHFGTEASLGLTNFWEVGGAFQAGFDPSGSGHFGGFKFRSKFMIPKQESDLVSYSMNVELGKTSHRFKEQEWATELRPIICLEGSRWHWHINPIIGWALSGATSLTPDLEFATKVGYKTDLGFSLGVEHFAELGAINAIPAVSEQEHVTFLVSEIDAKFLNIGLGVGHGLTSVSPQWITKLTIGKML